MAVIQPWQCRPRPEENTVVYGTLQKQDGNPYNGPSAIMVKRIMVKVKPVLHDGQNGPVGQDGQNGLVGQDGQNRPVEEGWAELASWAGWAEWAGWTGWAAEWSGWAHPWENL